MNAESPPSPSAHVYPSSIDKHQGFRRLFAPEKLTLGFILPLESYPNTAAPTMQDHAALTRLADDLGFAGLWARDVPMFDPNFGDTGQLYETFSYLGFLSCNTKRIALATGSAVITLRHPLHLAKQASSIDQMSGGRMVLGISSGDRPAEYPAFGLERDFDTRGDRFREAFAMFTAATEGSFPSHISHRFGVLDGSLGMVPRPVHGHIPRIVTGRSRQDMDWIAKNADGWLYYFVNLEQLATITQLWRQIISQEVGAEVFKPFSQGLFFDLDEDPDHPAQAIRAGLRVGRNSLVEYLAELQKLGVNHFAMNMKASRRPAKEILHELAEYVLPEFPSHNVPVIP
jgi:luciferase-type oxidoreductase